ncbi:histidine phosphatase family protein [Streptomyces sp. Tu 3180]|uniref:histidine phosphatase family protein n=1 Tax=Streptomyces sp. Tu 3180 TaxID=2682611 RepID=UPI00135B20CD|nr:histidine phosphatase family protein [Streptomyces sp. Tu 3180]KAF3466507.1 histidine phosphatase family protein [Streptomyces sp. Tu 3180]
MADSEEQELLSRLFLVRHGESTCNSVHRIAGQRDAPLTLLGRIQAEKVARGHRGRHFDRIYVSPLTRAYETADIVFGIDTPDPGGPDVVVDERLMERDFGSYTLESKSILQRRHGIAEYERAMNADSPTLRGGETFQRFKDRVHAFYQEELLPALRRGEVVCVVSHKYVVELICRFVLDRPADESYDLRLPNSQMLQGDRIHRYVENENKTMNMVYDWIVVNHPVVLCAGLAAGLLANVAGLRLSASPYLLLLLLVLASVITMCRIELENARAFVTDRGTLRSVALRYLVLPVAFAALVRWWDAGSTSTAAIAAVFLATPGSVVAMTVSRCLGGMIMPTFAQVLLSSLAAAVSFSAVLALTLREGVAPAVAISAATSTGVVTAAYLLVKRLRERSPIRTAKYGERNGYVAVLLLTAFIVLVCLELDLDGFATYAPTAVGIAVGLRLVAVLLKRRRHVQTLDDYTAMTYPNVFVVVIIAALTGNGPLEQVAIWTLLPMFVLSFFDSWYARFLVVAPDDARWPAVLGLPPSRPGRGRPAAEDPHQPSVPAPS